MTLPKTEAIILKKHDFRETSLVVTFFTRDFGKISGLLKGVRTEPRKFASPMELFSLNEIIFYPKRNSSLHIVSQCDEKNNFPLIRSNIMRAGFAATMMELLHAIMPVEDANTDVFDLAACALKAIETSNNPEKILTIFKIKILALSGFKPHFDSCVSCGNKILGSAEFSLAFGGLLCGSCNKKDNSSRTIFRGTIASILHIEKNNLESNLNLGLNPQIKRELEAILSAFLNFHLGKELKSQRVMHKLSAVV